jgi:aspartyl-tRNA(Asn)/glutamyl-tRNA(Gln) amidotransferase subunit A
VKNDESLSDFGAFLSRASGETGRTGPLADLSIAIKDNIDVAGWPTRAGLGLIGQPAADRDAPVVAALRQAGAALAGKTAMDEAALGASGDNPHSGRIHNPHGEQRSPGGSSGGSAVAVAAGLCDAALGTDTLGSVRIPAAYCGVVGLKPTRGLLPTAGVVPLSWSFDHVGILARSTEIVSRILAVLMGTAAVPAGRPSIAVPRQLSLFKLSPAIEAQFQALLGHLEAAGWRIGTVEIAGWAPAATTKAAFLVTEAQGAVIHEKLLATDDPALSAWARKLLTYGRDCGTGRLLKAQRSLEAVAAGLDRALSSVELLILPTMTHTAFRFGEPAPADQADLTVLANVGGQPAISLPMGTDEQGLPTAVQLIGRIGADRALLAHAATVEEIIGR